MSHYLRLRIVPPELAEQVEQRTFLGVGTGVGGLEALVQPPLVADTDALVVPAGGVRPDLVQWTAAVYLAVAGDVEMIADVTESPVKDMILTASLRRKGLSFRRGTAMNDN